MEIELLKIKHGEVELFCTTFEYENAKLYNGRDRSCHLEINVGWSSRQYRESYFDVHPQVNLVFNVLNRRIDLWFNTYLNVTNKGMEVSAHCGVGVIDLREPLNY